MYTCSYVIRLSRQEGNFYYKCGLKFFFAVMWYYYPEYNSRTQGGGLNYENLFLVISCVHHSGAYIEPDGKLNHALGIFNQN